jgi:plasmid maintenance system antidote protein VapI
VPAQHIGDIVAGKRAVTADTELRLAFEFNAARRVTVL